MADIIIGLIFIIVFILIFIFPTKLAEIFENMGILDFGLEKSGTRKLTTIRLISLISIFITIVFVSGKTELIVGFIGVVIGFVTMKYSLVVHNIIGSGKWFKGDNGIKLAGLIILLVSLLWMVGLSQQILVDFTEDTFRN